MTISPEWRAFQHCFSSQFCMHTDKPTAPVFRSITIQMYKARLKEMRNTLTEYSKQRKMKQLWLHRTPMFSCCTSELTCPTQLHAPYTLHKKRDAFTLIWMTREDLWLHPSFSTENKVFWSTLCCRHVFWNTTTIAPILCGTG